MGEAIFFIMLIGIILFVSGVTSNVEKSTNGNKRCIVGACLFILSVILLLVIEG